MKEILMEGLKTTILGMGVTFFGLWLLWLSAKIMSKVVRREK